MEITGLPLHPLVVHAVVVLAPLSAAVALAYAAVPRWRWLLRWPLVVLTVVAMAGAYLATLSGADLLESRPTLQGTPAVATHQARGELLRNALIAFTVVALAASFRLGGPTPLPSGRGGRDRRGGALDVTVTALLAVAALGVLVTAVLAGDSGARAVWG